ncbi:S9 family peptidase [Aestuariibacter salexigens]|uniref:S9 family peptidase n=1 Tax=Aestuariibacter salexigens TaxID=226010 RepID=UPI0004075FA6|nr:prolyl oligopeptidase family serine peptidase [Aestuariibacter salexigens]
MKITHTCFALSFAAATLSGCAATDISASTSPEQSRPASVATVVTPQTPTYTADGKLAITLEQIMADPDWLGRQPERAYWADDGQAVLYYRKREGSPIDDLWRKNLNADTNGETVALSELHAHAYRSRIVNSDNSMAAWVFEDNLFVKDLSTGVIRQLTRGGDRPYNLQFMLDGSIGMQRGNAYYTINPASGLTSQLVSWRFAAPPKAVEAPKDYIAQEQIKLIDYVALQRNNRLLREEHQQLLQQQNATVTPEPLYFDAKLELARLSVSPAGDKAVFALREDTPNRSETDIMPNYIQEDGRIAAEPVRRRVADAEPQSHELWLADLQNGTTQSLSYQTLPGYNEDVLADVKRENAKAKGEDYQVNRLPRAIGLINDWYWSESPIQWNRDGQQVAIMLEAWDNKDRWIATVDFDDSALVSEHRLHDDAWINYRFNTFGWLNQSDELFFISEQSGYAHLYIKAPGEKERALTSGNYEVDDLTLTRDDGYFYFKANKKHPGIYEIYRVNVLNGQHEMLTDLNGMTDYVLSPQEDALLLTHSKVTQPPELYVQNVGNTDVVKLTDTVSDAFKSMPWTAPQIVAIPSSHDDQPIYSRVYLPKGGDGSAKRAVVFNHGAGYLQNAHLGWSGYFREFMFHSMLAQQGYVVLDMDYRASAGYGRDWRTAIYRRMGTPEVEDLRDGVSWLVDNAGVDRQRIGTYGGSYGGFLTFMSLFTAPELFQSGAALRPVSDWAHYNHPYTSNILNTPDVDPIAYERSSPIYFAEGLQKPLLINAPMIDNNVFFVDVVRLVQRLIELEKEDFETAIYPVEPHGFVQPSSWLDEYRRIYKLFEETL